MTAPVKLLYFAWLREKAGVGEEDVPPPATVATVAQLIDWLEAQGGGRAE
ncbi:MAG: MoaD/ThiS family protein, partial [Rhodospirillales bacterium]